MRAALIFGGLTIATLAGFACSSSVKTPHYTRQPTSALVEVPYPPPPARVEQIPQQPNDAAVWIDGEWVWQTRRWAWRKGRWVVPPAGASFAPWTTVRDATGTLYVATGMWRNANGEDVAEPPAISPSKPQGMAVVTNEGDQVDIGRPASPSSWTSERRDAAAQREANDLDASGPPTLASDAAVTEQLLDGSALTDGSVDTDIPSPDASVK